jgi:hypothetical protein
MENKTKRILLFLFGCMGTRLAIVWLAYKRPDLLRVMGFLALIPAFGFMYIYMNGLRKTGPEVFGERIWWNELRPVHSILWGVFAYLALTGVREHAWKVLLADVTLGFVAFLGHHLA